VAGHKRKMIPDKEVSSNSVKERQSSSNTYTRLDEPLIFFPGLDIIHETPRFRGGKQIGRINEDEKLGLIFTLENIITLNVGKCKTGVKTHSPEFHNFGVHKIQRCQLQEAGIILH
jgi:hypothetical protein